MVSERRDSSVLLYSFFFVSFVFHIIKFYFFPMIPQSSALSATDLHSHDMIRVTLKEPAGSRCSRLQLVALLDSK